MRQMERLVHIVPLGWERDRAVGPIEDAKAHRVHLISRTDNNLNKRFIKLTRDLLEPQVGRDNVELHKVPGDREFEAVLMTVARLILDESEAGNRIYVNMSASGKIAAAAAALACMYHRRRIAGLYYAKVRAYAVTEATTEIPDAGLSIDYQGTVALPVFDVRHHKEPAIRVLALLYNEGRRTFPELMDGLAKAGIDPFAGNTRTVFEKEHVTWNLRLRRRALDELTAAGLVKILPRGVDRRVRAELALEGEYHALASGLIKELREVKQRKINRRD